jgi:serine/threonine-protein kinase
MAHVYKGVHELLGREVAVKEVLPGSAKDKEAKERLQREALALSAFRHQNIVTLYDLIEKNDGLYLVMELVDGPTLGELLRDGPLPPEVAAVMASGLAQALEHAHFHGIVHRDLKPANIMFSQSGEVKLMDFGIAKDAELDTLTKEGLAVGTPAYMAPEQVMGQPMDGRTDLYALGVVLYECLAGDRPFRGDGPAQIYARIRDGRHEPVGSKAPQTPKALRRVVKRLMRAKPADRYANAAELRRELDVYLSSAVKVSQASVLLSFLHQRGKLDEPTFHARVSPQERKRQPGMKRSKAFSAGWAALLIVAAGLAGVWAAHVF